MKSPGQRAVPEEHFQYDTTSSAFQREEGLSRFLRPSTGRSQVFQLALLSLWGLVLIVVVTLLVFWWL